MTEPTLYWHDYETWGANPAIDRPSQFAGMRTNYDLEPVAEPNVWYCQPTIDVLPNPEAVLVTGITPSHAELNGLVEPEFIGCIHTEFSMPNTCGVGYNSIRFDDEVSRYGFYRNFYDPYAREWQNGNSRWDIIDMVRTCYALRPEGIEWPKINDKVSFKLEHLAIANHLVHARAHDALSDVEATIAMAKLIKTQQPELYNHIFSLRLKNNVAVQVDIKRRKPFLHVSSRFSAENGCAALVVPLAFHPKNKNAVLVFNLSEDPSDLIRLSAEQIAQKVFTAAADLPEGESRIGLKAVHLNKSPVVLTPKLLTNSHAARLGIDKSLCEKHWQQLLTHDVGQKIAEAFALAQFEIKPDAQQQLYEGFLPNRDKPLLEKVRKATQEQLANEAFYFNDQRYNDLLLRFKGRFYPGALSEPEQMQWQEICEQRWYSGVEGYLTLEQFNTLIGQLLMSDITNEKKILLHQTQQWVLAKIPG